jgi:hypothetical protein
MRSRRRLALAACGTLLLAAPLAAWQTYSRQDADRLQTKLAKITQVGDGARAGSRAAGPVSTVMSDTEVNAYLRYHAADQIPQGIVEPTLRAMSGGRIAGRAMVDLDAVRKQKERGWLDPLAYLTGSVPLTASGTLVTSGGVGRFQLETAELGGVSVPKSLIQELLTYYSRSPENPSGINMDDPFELPARIREIRVDEGRATVVQ